MDTKQMPRGTKSSEVVRVDTELFRAHSGQFLYMIQDYFKKSSDRSSDPVTSFNMIRERLSQDPKFMMLACMEHDIPVGFLAADIIGTTARIILGYAHDGVRPKAKNVIIDAAMAQFDAWSKEHKCTQQVFYTHRAPGAHKLMLVRGWEYELSIYRKET